MSPILIQSLTAITAILLILGVWALVHLLARRQMGERRLGCRGPQLDDEGNSVCCNDPDVPCESMPLDEAATTEKLSS